jgi:hypothetical protein
MIARPFDERLEGHGRIAGSCFAWRLGRKRQPLAVLLMAFALSQKP